MQASASGEFGKGWNRREVAKKMREFEMAAQRPASQRQLAEELEIPRSTLQHWLKRKRSIDADPEVVAFFESPAGMAFLHRLVLGAHFVMTLLGPCGIRLVCLFIELTGLDRFVVASYGAQHKVSMAMEEAVGQFGQEEQARLRKGMKPKKITVCEDETFHPQTCLVAIEPASNFILVEKYASNRKAEEWTAAVQEAMGDMPVDIVQSTSDEGRGIRCHVKEDLGAHHSPDLFHVQQELVRGTSVVLETRKREAEKALDREVGEVNRHGEEKEAYFGEHHGPGRPPGFDKRIEEAMKRENEARESLERASEHQERTRMAIREVSEAYHPYCLQTGASRSAEEVATTLEKCFSEIEDVAREASLPERCLQKIRKAKRVVVEMVATIAFFFLMIRGKVEALGLSPEVEEALFTQLIPGIYLHLAAQKAETAEQKHQLADASEKMLGPLNARDGPLWGLGKEELILIEQVAEECAQMFQRSSSCVEGRNGQLALRHHSLHRISNRKLKALTAAHNYFVKRSDGTTPAERFFRAKPRDMFEWLLDKIDLPGRPAKKRSQPTRKEYVSKAVA